MRISLNLAVFGNMSLDEALDSAASMVDAVEINVDSTDRLTPLNSLAKSERIKHLRKLVDSRGLVIAAVGNHLDTQLVSGANSADTSCVFDGSVAEKQAYGRRCLLRTARIASELEVSTVVGFTGCEDWSRWLPWPDKQGWDLMLERFAEEWTPILEEIGRLGVRFAHEPHPKQMVHNLETAIVVADALGWPEAWGYNLDIGNLLLSGVDPVLFIREIDNRVFHVHAKDFEMVRSNVARSGWHAHGPWDRRERGFRFRIPGWGNAEWKEIVSELQLADYDGYLSIEHEDPVFSRREGVKRSFEFLDSLIIREPREPVWW